MLDRAHPLLHREAHILGADVVLEIDEGFRSTVGGTRLSDMRFVRRGNDAADRVGSPAARSEPRARRRFASSSVAFHERGRKIEGGVAGAG